jgi:flavin-binding protein dodecin
VHIPPCIAASARAVCSRTTTHPEDTIMTESVYKVIELVGTSTESWEKAAAAAISRAGKTLRDLRVAEVSELDLQLNNGKVETYRAKVKVSFKYEDG